MSFEDKAQEHEAMEWAQINAPRPPQPTYKPGEPGYGPELCKDCDETMPDVRRAYGFLRCTACASALEPTARRR